MSWSVLQVRVQRRDPWWRRKGAKVITSDREAGVATNCWRLILEVRHTLTQHTHYTLTPSYPHRRHTQ